MGLFQVIRDYLSKARDEADMAHQMANQPAAASPSAAARTAWVGVDLDGTLAYFNAESTLSEVGPPIPPMLERVRAMIARGERVKIVTAWAAYAEQVPLIQKWLRENGLPPLEVTNIKDFNMIRLYDDRCIQVESNTGRIITDAHDRGEDGF